MCYDDGWMDGMTNDDAILGLEIMVTKKGSFPLVFSRSLQLMQRMEESEDGGGKMLICDLGFAGRWENATISLLLWRKLDGNGKGIPAAGDGGSSLLKFVWA
jgi:hypothetical protein